MQFTFWPSLTSSEGGHTEIQWTDFLTFISTPQIANDKTSLEGWSPVKFAGNRRAAKAVEAVSAIVLDDDRSGFSTDALANLWADFAGAIHPSFSHTSEHPKHRIVLRTSRDMTADEHARVWRHVCDVATSRGQTIDQATKDASRLWFVPAHRDGLPYAWHELAGAPIDVDAVLNLIEPAPTATASPPTIATAAPNRRHAFAVAMGAAWPAKGRHEAQLALAGALRAEGWSEAEALEFLCTVARTAGDEDRTKREATIRHTWSKTGPLTGWTRLKAHVDPVVVDAARNALGVDAEWTERAERRLEQAATAPTPTPTEGDVTAGPFTFKVGGLDAPLPPLVYTVDGLVCKGDVCMFVAHGNSLKTWLALSLSVAVSNGRPWLARYLTQRGRAAILDFESGDFEIVRRLKMLGAKDAEIDGRLLRCSYSGAHLNDPETWIALAELGLGLLVVDSFNAASPATDENDARSAGMLQHAGRFANATGCTVIFIHHARKGSGGDRRESVRGSTALFAACDRIFEFTDLEKKDGGAVLSTLRSVKDGAGRAPLPVRVELNDQGLRYVDNPPDAESEDEGGFVEAEKRLHNEILRLLRLDQHSNGMPKQDLLARLRGSSDSRRRVLAELVTEDFVVEYRDARKVWIRIK